jgi:uncharacterized protein (TIGR00297 family)
MTRFAIAALFGVAVASLSLAGRLLTVGGAITQCVMACILFGLGGWQYILPIAAFFLLSSFLSRIHTETKLAAQQAAAKGSRRDSMQVLANGTVATVVLIVAHFSRHESLYITDLGAVAAATADTWGTEIGGMARTRPILLSALRPVPPGTSGAISFHGSLAGVVGTLAIWFSGAPWIAPEHHLHSLAAVTIGGVAGSLLDSLLGSTAQASYECTVCGRAVERAQHCGNPCLMVRGMKFVNNDLVNAVCAAVGAVVSGIAYSI